ncbi:MAG: GMC family oxidoreductase, partial [Acidobacteriales bacterium]|nr:GMC family oxidoreductase [Terriglobales bacterium]
MILDLNHDLALPEFSADVCIVGAGAAGLVLAAELIQKNKRVLLLESGGLTLEAAPQILNQCEHTGQPHQGANIGRFRALGGTTTAWGGQILELNAEDFTPRTWIPGSGWPFTKEVLAPYYQRALQSEGLAVATQNDEDLWHQMKIPLPNLGRELTPYFTRWCPEPNFARLYREVLHSSNLCVVLHATATRMQLSHDGTHVRGIECTAPSGTQKIFYADQYVLALGTIESVRFLLQPLPGAQTPAWNRSGLLGRHFQSHIDINAARISAVDATRLHPWFANAYRDGYKYHPKFRLASAAQQQDQILNIAGSITCINP